MLLSIERYGVKSKKKGKKAPVFILKNIKKLEFDLVKLFNYKVDGYGGTYMWVTKIKNWIENSI